jgi:hypothetical protein
MQLGELLKSILEGAGQGAQHQYAQAARGGDYLQDEERLATAGQSAAISRGTSVRDALLKQAAVEAAAKEARTRGVASPGADPVTASAELDESRKSAKEAADLEKFGTAAALSEARAAGVVGADDKMQNVLDAIILRNKGNQGVASTRAQALIEAARERARNRPAPSEGQALPWTKDGVQGFYYPRTNRFQEGPGGRKTPTDAVATKEADISTMIANLDAMEQIPDGVLGPKAAMVAGARGGLIADTLGVDPPSEEYATAQALVGGTRDIMVHELTGAAASVPEMRRLIQHIPDTSQRDVVRKANIRITKVGLQIAQGLKNGTLTPEEARGKVLQLLGSPAAPSAAPAAAPAAAGKVLTFNPQTGELE